MPTFVALLGAQTHLNVTVLVDYQKNDQQLIENLYKEKLLKKQKVLTYADFTGSGEADVEDMFGVDFYLKLVNGEYRCGIQPAELTSRHPRVLRRIEEYLENSPLPKGARFNHYRPARYFSDHVESLRAELSESTLACFERAFQTANALL